MSLRRAENARKWLAWSASTSENYSKRCWHRKEGVAMKEVRMVSHCQHTAVSALRTGARIQTSRLRKYWSYTFQSSRPSYSQL